MDSQGFKDETVAVMVERYFCIARDDISSSLPTKCKLQDKTEYKKKEMVILLLI